MTRWVAAVGALLLVATAAAAWLLRPVPDRVAQADRPPAVAAARSETPGRQPTLYCEFNNFADRTPLVGFYFLIDESTAPPVYAQIFQREQDGTQVDFGSEAAPPPHWAFEGSDSPAVIRSPDDAILINLYDYDSKKPGLAWFEAGLRSVRYKNLGGRCRRSTA